MMDCDRIKMQKYYSMTAEADEYLERNLGEDFQRLFICADLVNLPAAKEFVEWWNENKKLIKN